MRGWLLETMRRKEEGVQQEIEAKQKELDAMVAVSRMTTTIANNAARVLLELNHNSPLRRPLLGELTKGLTQEEAVKFFKFSPTTVQQAFTERELPKERSGLYNIRYKPNTKQKRYKEERKKIPEALNDIAPQPSARPFRICTTTKKQFYADYVKKATANGSYVFSKHFLLNNFLKRRHYHKGKKRTEDEGERIHWTKDASFSKHCRRYKELKRKEELTSEETTEFEEKKLYKALIQAQQGHFLLLKQDLTEGLLLVNTVLVLLPNSIQLRGAFGRT